VLPGSGPNGPAVRCILRRGGVAWEEHRGQDRPGVPLDGRQDMTDTPNPIQVQKFLGGIDYPASKQDIVSTAEGNGADENVLNALKNIPDQDYDAPTAVSAAISES
jgi:hypothetical protein